MRSALRERRDETRAARIIPISRLNDALQAFHRAVRAQLRAPDPEDVLHSDDLEILASGLKPLPMSKRSSLT